MRSSEVSGAGALGFRAGLRQQKHSPMTKAVAATAFLAASLFTIHDAVRTFADLQRELTSVGTMMATRLARQPEILSSDLDLSIAQLSPITRASFINADPAPGLLAHHLPAGDGGTLALEIEHTHALAGVAGRSGVAFALAGLLTLGVRIRRRSGMPDPVQRENYSQLAKAIPMGLACWTANGDLIVCNENYRRRLELDETEVSYHQAVARLIASGHMNTIRDDAQSRILELHCEDGTCLMIDERPLEDGGFMTLVTDITESKRTSAMLDAIRHEQRLLARRYHQEKLKAEAASHAKTNFLAHLSHDIRTPLNHIIGFADLMEHQTYGALGDPRYTDYVQTIKTSGQNLLNTFAAILDLAELETGRRELRQDIVFLDEVLDSVTKRFASQAKGAGIRFHVGKPTGAVLRGDRLGMVRMVGNIVENSIRFTRAGGSIRLAAFAADDGVVIEISDTGIGMDEERLASLSQPFAMGDATFTREGGPGFGISIARAIAELSGGHIAIDSSPSLGTTVAATAAIEPAAAALVAA